MSRLGHMMHRHRPGPGPRPAGPGRSPLAVLFTALFAGNNTANRYGLPGCRTCRIYGRGGGGVLGGGGLPAAGTRSARTKYASSGRRKAPRGGQAIATSMTLIRQPHGTRSRPARPGSTAHAPCPHHDAMPVVGTQHSADLEAWPLAVMFGLGSCLRNRVRLSYTTCVYSFDGVIGRLLARGQLSPRWSRPSWHVRGRRP